VALALLLFRGGSSANAPPIVIAPASGGHGSEDDGVEIIPPKLGVPWGSGLRKIEISGLKDPDAEDMEMLIHLIGLLDD